MSEYGDYTHYDTVAVDEDASQEIIESAYQYLCHKWHPNKHPEQRAEAERRLAALSRAYRVISKPEKRAEYDAWLLKQRGGEAPKKSNADAAGTVSTIQSKGHPFETSAIPEAQFSDVSQSEPPSPKFSANDFSNVAHTNDSQSLPEGYEYASFWARAGALISDTLAVWLMLLLLGGLLAVLGIFTKDTDPYWFGVIQAAVAISYYVRGWAGEDMATYGKKVFGLEIRTEQFERISYRVAINRMIAWTMGSMLLGVTYLTQPFNKKRQCLHDMSVSTVVIKRLDAHASRGTIIATWSLVILLIVGILAAIALPAYQTYVAKAKVAAAYSELMTAAKAVTENEYRGGAKPSDLAAVGYVSSAPNSDWSGPTIYSEKDTFFIHVDFVSEGSLAARGGRLAVFPYVDDGNRLLWKCYAYELDASLLPNDCEIWKEQN